MCECMAEGFAIRHRGAHVRDQIRRLELLAPCNAPRSPSSTSNDKSNESSSCRPLAPPRVARDLANRSDRHIEPTSPLSSFPASLDKVQDFANVFGNLTVWIDTSMHRCVYHAGYDKIHLYVAFLHCFLLEMLPQNDQVHRGMQQLEAYVRYLSTSEVDETGHTMVNATEGNATNAKHHAVPPTTATTSPRIPGVRTDRLSPKMNVQSAVLIPQMLSSSMQSPRVHSPRVARAKQLHDSQPQQQQPTAPPGTPGKREPSGKKPQLTYPKRKKIVQMSDHEEAILELVLYFDEVLRKMGDQRNPVSGEKVKQDALSYTEQWVLLTSEAKVRILRQLKKQLSRRDFFPCSSAYNSVASSLVSKAGEEESALGLISVLTAAQSVHTTSGSKGDDKHHHKMDLASYFSLVLLCLHESIRRVGVFSLELAEFARKVVCEDSLALCEDMFTTISKRQKLAQQQLSALKQSKLVLQQSVREIEDEIQRLQSQNMRSLNMCNLEKQELVHLEREEQWHGHCKSLIVNCIAELQDSVNIPAWLQTPSNPLHGRNDDDDEGIAPLHQSNALQTRSSDYQRLAPGFAAFHFRLRFQVVYIAHLALLCRSYLHLHERRSVREVMNSTSIDHSGDQLDAQTAAHENDWQQQSLHFLSETGSVTNFLSFNPINNSMERISLSELHTLREINDALRAIETLYAETGATSGQDHSQDSSAPSTSSASSSAQRRVRRPRLQRRSFGTQFPAVGAGDTRGFLRSLSYCTIAATTLSSLSSSFLPVGLSTKLQADIEAHRENVVVLGSGRRRSSVAFRDREARGMVSNQPQIRLNKAVLKFPKHVKDLLVLPLLEGEAFSGDASRSIATSMSKDEIIEKIHWVYRMALDNAYASSSSSGSTAALNLLPVSLCNPMEATSSSRQPSAWTCEHFVDFIYANIFDAERGGVYECEREFVRFFASIQLFLTNSSPSTAGPPPGNAPSGPILNSQSSMLATETIYLFALLTKLYHSQTKHDGKRKQLPSRVFPVLFYCQRVLLHVSVSKKAIQSSGISLDVWSVASEEMVCWGLPHSSQQTAATASSSKRGLSTLPGAGNSTPFVLLESVKVLLLHVASFSPAAEVVSAMLEERFRFLLEKSTLATVSLLTPVTPGSYHSSSSTTPAAAGPTSKVPNGQLAEAPILPMDLAVTTIVRAWIEVHDEIERRLGVTLQGALADAGGRISFEEFVHVMTAYGGSQGYSTAGTGGTNSSGSSSSISRSRLAQIYASSVAKSRVSRRDPGEGAQWRHLLHAVVDDVDIMGMHERFLSVDFRSIHHALLSVNNASSPLGQLSTWLLGAKNLVGTTQALQKSWSLHRQTMKEHIALAFQAENALDGVRCWQSTKMRFEKVQQILGADQSPKPRHSVVGACSVASTAATVSSSTTEKDKVNARREEKSARSALAEKEFENDELEVAWKAYYLLQWDHTRAHHLADQVRLKQQRSQKQVQSPSSNNPTTLSTAASSQATQQHSVPASSTKAEELRPQRPVPPRTPHHRVHRS